MITNIHPILKPLYNWISKKKLRSENPTYQYNAINILGKIGNHKQIILLSEFLKHNLQYLKNEASMAISNIFLRIEDPEIKQEIELSILKQFKDSNSISEKMVLAEIIRNFNLKLREEIFGPLVAQSEDDLQYMAIRALSDTLNFDILDDIISTANTPDLVLRKSALQIWYFGIKNQNFDDALKYATPRIHYLIRAAYELQTDGEFLKEILAHSANDLLPKAKAYPDFIIRYFTELLGNWSYDPDAYRSLHIVLVPSYFTFDNEEADGEESPFIIL